MHLNRNLIKIPKLPILKIFDMISHNWKHTLCLTHFLSPFFFSSTSPSPCLRHLLFFPYLYIHIYIYIDIYMTWLHFLSKMWRRWCRGEKKGKKRNKRCQEKCTFSIMTSHIKDLKNEQFWNFHLISIQGHILGIILSIIQLRWNVKVEIPKKYALEMLVFEDKWRKAKTLGSNPLLFLFLLSKTFLPIMFNLIGPWCVETKRVEWQWEEFSMDY